MFVRAARELQYRYVQNIMLLCNRIGLWRLSFGVVARTTVQPGR